MFSQALVFYKKGQDNLCLDVYENGYISQLKKPGNGRELFFEVSTYTATKIRKAYPNLLQCFESKQGTNFKIRRDSGN